MRDLMSGSKVVILGREGEENVGDEEKSKIAATGESDGSYIEYFLFTLSKNLFLIDNGVVRGFAALFGTLR